MDGLRSDALDSRCGDRARWKASRKVVNVEELLVPRDVDLNTSGRSVLTPGAGFSGVVSVAVAMRWVCTVSDVGMKC
jgi:hypothetical protein